VGRKRSGLTVIEILVVVGIIALLVGLLLPAVHTVQKMAKDTKQRAQFTAIGLGLAAFKNDYGDYPPSNWMDPTMVGAPQDYCGAQKLAEALVGWDLLGFHPDSAWRADGLDKAAGPTTYDPLHTDPTEAGLKKRKDRYLELDTANAFRLGESTPGARDGLFVDTTSLAGTLAPNTHVLCDVFTVNERKILLTPASVLPTGTVIPPKLVSPGTPILYYKANPTSKLHRDPTNLTRTEYNIYNARDCWPLVSLGRLADGALATAARRTHPLADFDYFYEYIRDPKVQARPWPYRSDSYLLISAGADGLYGTDDDIRNFGG
jgi:type II secretory pathway pseudopilin PulG